MDCYFAYILAYYNNSLPALCNSVNTNSIFTNNFLN